MPLGENGKSQTRRRVLVTRPLLHFDDNTKPYNSSVDIVTILCVLKPKNVSFHNSQTGSGNHPAFYSVGTKNTFLGVHRLQPQVDHSPPIATEVKNEGISASTPSVPSWRTWPKIYLIPTHVW